MVQHTPESERPNYVDQYLGQKLANRSDLKNKREEFVKAAEVVNVALDYGIVRLRRAQNMTSPVERKAELEGAVDSAVPCCCCCG